MAILGIKCIDVQILRAQFHDIQPQVSSRGIPCIQLIKTKLAGNPSSTKKETGDCHLRLPDHNSDVSQNEAQTLSTKLLYNDIHPLISGKF